MKRLRMYVNFVFLLLLLGASASLQSTIVSVNQACAISGDCQKVLGGCNQTCAFGGLNAARDVMQLTFSSTTQNTTLVGKVLVERAVPVALQRGTVQKAISYIPTQGKLAGKEIKILFFLIDLADTASIQGLPLIMQREVMRERKINVWASYVLYIFKALDQKFFTEIANVYINEIPVAGQVPMVVYPDGNFSMTVPAQQTTGERKILVDVKSID